MVSISDRSLLFVSKFICSFATSDQFKFIILENKLFDEELGCLLILLNNRARRLTFRVREDAIYVTVPPGTTSEEIKRAMELLRPKLKKAKMNKVPSVIDLNYRINTEFFKLSLVMGEQEHFLSRMEGDVLQLICPANTDFADPQLQEWLHKVIGEALRRTARIVLPPRLAMLAERYHLSYRCVRINSSRGRWGSCSASQNINLSYYLMLIPSHLVDYVLLHELAHTREMNHGTQFWELLDSLTEQKARELRKELMSYHLSF